MTTSFQEGLIMSQHSWHPVNTDFNIIKIINNGHHTAITS